MAPGRVNYEAFIDARLSPVRTTTGDRRQTCTYPGRVLIHYSYGLYRG